MALYHYRATDLKVIDGDTVELTAHLGFHVTKRLRVRLEGCDAPELRGVERLEGLESKKALEEVLARCEPEFRVHTFKGRSFNRYRATVTAYVKEDHVVELGPIANASGGKPFTLRDFMVLNGFARPGEVRK